MSRKGTTGAWSITSRGINASSVTLGSAISKAITLASRAQRDLGPDETQSIYIGRLGEEHAARVDFDKRIIQTHSFSATR